MANRLPVSYALGPWTWIPISSLPVIFLLSGLIRLVAAGSLLHLFKEVRPVQPIRSHELISVLLQHATGIGSGSKEA